jgi:hypothetical protein
VTIARAKKTGAAASVSLRRRGITVTKSKRRFIAPCRVSMLFTSHITFAQVYQEKRLESEQHVLEARLNVDIAKEETAQVHARAAEAAAAAAKASEDRITVRMQLEHAQVSAL